MKSFYRAHFLAIEGWGPLLLAAILLVLWPAARFWPATVLGAVSPTVYATVSALAGGLLGFIIAGVAILLTMPDSPRTQIILEAPVTARQLFGLFSSAARWLAVAALVTLLGLVIDQRTSALWWYPWIVAGILATTTLRVWRCIWALESMIRILLKDREQPLGRI